MTEKEEKNNEKKEEETKNATKAIEDILSLNKLGALCIRADNFEKAEKILSKTLKFYLEKIANGTVPYFFLFHFILQFSKSFFVPKKIQRSKTLLHRNH